MGLRAARREGLCAPLPRPPAHSPYAPTALYHHTLSLQEKAELKRQKDEAEAKYKYALVDGRQEQVRCRFLCCT